MCFVTENHLLRTCKAVEVLRHKSERGLAEREVWRGGRDAVCLLLSGSLFEKADRSRFSNRLATFHLYLNSITVVGCDGFHRLAFLVPRGLMTSG